MVLKFYVDFHAKHGVPATALMAARHFGRSSWVISACIERLIAKRLLRRLSSEVCFAPWDTAL